MPDAAVPLLKAVCIADGWDQVTPPTLGGYVNDMILRYFKGKIVEQGNIKANQDIQDSQAAQIASATALLGI